MTIAFVISPDSNTLPPNPTFAIRTKKRLFLGMNHQETLDYNGCSPQGEKQKCLKSLTVTGLYAEREVFFS